MVESPRTRQVSIRVDGEAVSIPERITVRRALELLGYTFGSHPGKAISSHPVESEDAGAVPW
jgi:hypothetical protein